MMKYPVAKPYFTEDEISLVQETLDSGWVAQGPKVAEFEKCVAGHEGVAQGVATTSCTTALHLAMVASGLSMGMDAIAPAFTFVATENAIVMTGATPILCDICEDTFNIDVTALQKIIEKNYEKVDGILKNKSTGNKLWGIVPVHEFGLCCNIYEINAIARKYGLCVIEDAACALGAKIHDIHQGAFGNISCVSFHPRKSITTGEGGMVLTNDTLLAEKMRQLRTHGSMVSADARDKGHGFLLPEFPVAGYNYRMTDVQGAMGLAQMKKLDDIISSKRKGAMIYDNLLQKHVPELIPPQTMDNYYHTYQSYVCMLNMNAIKAHSIEEGGLYRNELLLRLEEQGVATRQGTHAVHMLGYYRNRFGYVPEDFPHAYACDRLSIALPLYVGLTEEDQKDIVRIIRTSVDSISRGNR